MKAFMYCRVNSQNKKVARPDSISSQHLRCRAFLKEMKIFNFWRYSDDGEMHPVDLLPSMKELLKRIEHEEERFIIVTDHPGRLGKDEVVRLKIIKLIEDAGGKFISPMQKKPEMNHE